MIRYRKGPFDASSGPDLCFSGGGLGVMDIESDFQGLPVQ